ncbi:MAG: transcriptional repressor [Smithellaceae bacterium]
MKTEKKIFHNYLARRNLRGTSQRELILEAFLSIERHVSSEELYDFVRENDPAIGQATVYRVMKLLIDAGLARGLDFGDGVMRYEHAHNHPHHDHLLCRKCGKTLEVIEPVIEELQSRVAQNHGFELTDHKMYLYGLCPDCIVKNS